MNPIALFRSLRRTLVWHFGAWSVFTLVAIGQRAVSGLSIALVHVADIARWTTMGAVLSLPLLVALATASPLRRYPIRIALTLGVGMPLVGVVWWVSHRVLSSGWEAMPWPVTPDDWRGAGSHALILIAWSAVLITRAALHEAAESARAAQEAARLTTDARYRLLLAQVHPHFLFNTLNAIRALTSESPERAQVVITELATLMRAWLGVEPLGASTLGEDVELQRAYLRIEQIRFEERLTVSIDIDEQLRRQLWPPLLLAPLVENAVTHGRGIPLSVAIEGVVVGDRARVTVRNTGAWSAPGGAHSGMGLQNVRERLHLMFGSAASLDVHGDGSLVHATITCPLRHA